MFKKKKRIHPGALGVAQKVKAPTAKPDSLSLTLGLPWWEDRADSRGSSSDSHSAAVLRALNAQKL